VGLTWARPLVSGLSRIERFSDTHTDGPSILFPAGGDGMGLGPYADLAHAIWSVANASMAADGFKLNSDGTQHPAELTERWNAYGRDLPWQ
jgi:hypothetical protein